MSATTTPPAQATPTVASKIAEYGTIAVSLAVFAVYAIGFVFVRNDQTLLTVLIGTAAANATTAVGYWLGSSQGSAKKTDLMAANPPPVPVVTDPAATVTRTTSTSQTVAPVVTPIPTPAPTLGPLTP